MFINRHYLSYIYIYAKITLNVHYIFRFLSCINVCIVTYDTTRVRRYIFSHTIDLTDTFMSESYLLYSMFIV